MKIRSLRMCAVLLVSMACGLPLAAATRDHALRQVKAETERLRQELKHREGEQWQAQPALEDILGRGADAAEAGRLYHALERLQQALDYFSGSVSSHTPGALAQSMSEFESAWRAARPKLAAFDAAERRQSWAEAPAAVRALAEAARIQVMPQFDASRAYASADTPASGYFYLGAAQGNAEFVRFARALAIRRTGTPRGSRSMAGELRRLQQRTNAAFQPPRSIEKHTEFIQLNSALKVAQELDQARLYTGALYKYLEALRLFALLDASAPDEARQEQLRAALAEARRRIQSSKGDDSLALLFVERAESRLAAKPGAAPNAADWRNLAVIVEQVLPAYYAALEAAPGAEPATPTAVAVTLVRWPYT